MTDPTNRPDALASTVDCGVCGSPLEYATDPVTRTCEFCGRKERTLIMCPAGHYVCDACHGKAAMEVVREILAATRSNDALEIAERLMAIPSLPMHGPEHHAIVPGAIVTAVRNSGHRVAEGSLEKALERGAKVPGGWCGYFGACGAAIGVGVAVSVLTGATPIKGPQRSQALAAMAAALGGMVDDEPRCCKRATRVAVIAATEFLRGDMGIELPRSNPVVCAHSPRNAQCARERCPFFAPPS